MSPQPFNPNLIGGLESLQHSVSSVETMMRRLDKIVNGTPHISSSRYIRTPHNPKQGSSLFEQLAPSLIRDIFSSLNGNGGTSRASQGQMMSDLASALSRASKRYL